jgi:hypothetical protein
MPLQCRSFLTASALILACAAAAPAAQAPSSVPIVPVGLIATGGNGQVTLNWTADPASNQVATYNVYRVGQTFTGPWASPTGTTFTNASGIVNGTHYCYQVSATNASGTSAESAAVCATPNVPVVATPVVPAVPTSLTASAGNAQVTLKWMANPTANKVTTYNVYRVGQTFTGPWASPTATTFTNSGSVVNGTQYCYQQGSGAGRV